MTPAPIFKRFLAIGVGLIGGSACLSAKQKGLVGHVLGYSRKLETSHEALKLGIVDECVSDASDPNLRNVDAVLLSIPVRQYEKVLRQFLPVLPAHALIFDAGSTKNDVRLVLEVLDHEFPGLKSRFVGAHPIAGGERHGPKAAVTGLFQDKTCVICASPDVEPARKAQVEKFWASLGARLVDMDPLDHDEMFGAVSHLPHLLAFAYVASVLEHPKGARFMAEGGAGFRDFTRIAASSPEMWADIFQNNDKALLSLLDGFEQTLAGLRQAIHNKDRKVLDETLKKASLYREAWTQATVSSNQQDNT